MSSPKRTVAAPFAGAAIILGLTAGGPAAAGDATLAALGEHRRQASEAEGESEVLSARSVAAARSAGPAPTQDPRWAALVADFIARLEPRYVAPEDRAYRAIPDGEVLVFQIKMGRYTIDAPVTAVKRGRGLMIPVGEFARAMFLAVDLNPEATRAEGWAFAEDHLVSIDAETRAARAGEEEWTLAPEHIESDGFEVLLHTDELARWLEMEIDIDFRFLTMEIATKRRLPIITQLERRKRAKKSDARAAPRPSLPPRDEPYRLLSTPTVDMQGTYAFRDTANGDSSSTWSHSVLASGDMARMSGLFFVSGDVEDPARLRRLTLSRVSSEGDLAGPFNATRVEAGDIQGVDLPFAAGAALQRGINLTNRPTEGGGAFGTTDITGDVQPGWDVELYRNNVLVAFQTVAEDGRYTFEDVQLFAGQNQFRIVYYGPQGQVREETRSVSTAPNAVGERLVYDLALAEQGRALLGASSQIDDDADVGVRGTARARARLGGVVADVGYDSVVQADERRHQVIAGLSTGLGAAVVRANARADLSGGVAAETSVARPILGQQARLAHTVYSDFPGTGDPISGGRTDASLQGTLPRLAGQAPSYQLDGSRSDLGAGETVELEGRLSTKVSAALLDAGVRWETDSASEEDDILAGRFGATFNSRRLLTRARLSTDLQEGDLTDADVSARYRFTRDLSVNARAQNTFATGETIVEARADWDAGRVEFGPRMRWSSEGEWDALVDGRVSFGWDPLRNQPRLSSTRGSGAGAVAVRVFEDRNGDGRYNRGDALVEGAEVNAVQARRNALSDEKGVAYLARMPVYRRTDVRVEPDSLIDPFLAPLDTGVSLVPRPGKVQSFDIALVATSEVEGAVTVRSARGGAPVAGALVRAIDSLGAVRAEARTSSDGFFVLSDLPVGSYRLLVDRTLMDRRGWRPDRTSFITVRRSREIVVRNISLAGRDAPPLDPFESGRLVQVEGARLADALRERPGDGGYAVSLGAYDSKFGRDAAMMMLLARFPEEMASLHLVSPDASLLGDQLLALGPVANESEAKRLCAQLKPVAGQCAVTSLGFRGAARPEPSSFFGPAPAPTPA
ncbi:MAG: carboxypeptidase-like regulatory domain-containing protein, partial [Caulobacterales bacterium]|nr:carboxypeptidase-like regulatory domain-containing protein [Caulobacterales bacterium]